MTNQPQPPLEVGAVYRVEWDDCCTTGWFKGRFVGIKHPGYSDGSGDPDTDCDEVVFDTGAVTDGWTATYTRVTMSNDERTRGDVVDRGDLVGRVAESANPETVS